jgi:uncharacterized protein
VASTTPQRQFERSARPLSGGSLVAGLAGGLAIVSIMGMLGGPLSTFDMFSTDVRLRIAFGLLICVALMCGFVVSVWRAPVGLVAAILTGLMAALLLWLMRVFLLQEGQYNRLVFGPVGLIAVVIAASFGGFIAHLLDDNRLHARFTVSDAARVGLWAACLWVSFEVVTRMAGTLVLAPIVGNMLAGDLIAIAVGMPAAAWIISRYGEANGITSTSWEYRWTPLALGAGVIGGLIALGLMWGTARVDEAVWGVPDAALDNLTAGLQAGAWVGILMLVVNGVVGPASEELAWRGVAQTALVRAWGIGVGIAVTGVLFAAKHVIVDGSLARITTLVMLGLVLGVVRFRWGTGSSTVAHVVVNLVSTGVVITST